MNNHLIHRGDAMNDNMFVEMFYCTNFELSRQYRKTYEWKHHANTI